MGPAVLQGILKTDSEATQLQKAVHFRESESDVEEDISK